MATWSGSAAATASQSVARLSFNRTSHGARWQRPPMSDDRASQSMARQAGMELAELRADEPDVHGPPVRAVCEGPPHDAGAERAIHGGEHPHLLDRERDAEAGRLLAVPVEHGRRPLEARDDQLPRPVADVAQVEVDGAVGPAAQLPDVAGREVAVEQEPGQRVQPEAREFGPAAGGGEGDL